MGKGIGRIGRKVNENCSQKVAAIKEISFCFSWLQGFFVWRGIGEPLEGFRCFLRVLWKNNPKGVPMKFIYLAALLVPFASALGQEGEKFAEHKAKMISHLEERIAKMQELKSCAEKATDKEGLKACHKDMKEWRDERREGVKEKREARKNRREERRKAKDEKEE
jgi:hypothetical protein